MTIQAVSLNACMSRKSTLSLSGLNMDGLLTYEETNWKIVNGLKKACIKYCDLFPVLSSVQGPHDRPVLPAGPDDGVADGADAAQVDRHPALLHLKVRRGVRGRGRQREDDEEGQCREEHLAQWKLDTPSSSLRLTLPRMVGWKRKLVSLPLWQSRNYPNCYWSIASYSPPDSILLSRISCLTKNR